MHIGENLVADKKEREGEYVGNGFTTLDLYGSGNLVPWEYGGFALDAMDGHGGWLATSRDMVRLLVAVDGFSTKPDILSSGTIATMVTPSSNNPNYAKGWSVNTANNWWHTGAVDGTASVFVRSNSGYTWAIILNKRVVDGNANAFWAAVDAMGWNCIAGVSTFPSHDLMDSPTVNASALTVDIVNNTTLDVAWANGNGTSRIVVAKEISGISGNYNFSSYPLDGMDYNANSQFATGDNLGDDTYVVYNGTGNAVNIENLDPSGEYAIRVYEYTKNANNGDNALYLLGNAAEETSVLGVNDNELAQHLNIYPTVVSELLNIDLVNGQQEVDFILYDISGRVLSNGKFVRSKNHYDVSKLSSGIYLISIQANDKKQVYRIIKK